MPSILLKVKIWNLSKKKGNMNQKSVIEDVLL